jgi:hypothetical protein
MEISGVKFVESSNGRRNWRPWIIAGVAIVALIALWIAYSSHQEQQRRDQTLGAMVVAFQEQNSLSVFRAQVPVFVTNRSDGWIFDVEQSGVIPATVEYRLDLSQVTQDNFQWDRNNQVMTVTIPPLVIAQPVLDIPRARLVNRGIFVTGNTAMDLFRKNAAVAVRQARAEANNEQMMQLAREAARKAMIQNTSIPLRAAGFDDVRIVARFAGEERAEDPSYLDRSRSYNEVLEEAREKRATEGTQ